MKLYRLDCIDQDGYYEINGYFRYYENAKKEKEEMDNMPKNKKYGIQQNITTIETDD